MAPDTEIWDTYATLKILARDDVTMTCVGKALSRANARCRWVLSAETVTEMHIALEELSKHPPAQAIPRLRELARLGLCEARHEYQVDYVVAEWSKLIRCVELRMELESERKERRRLERLFVGNSEGYEGLEEDDDDDGGSDDNGGNSSSGENGQYSDEISDRYLLQALEEAEREQRSYQYSPSIPNSDEVFSTPTAPFSEYQPSVSINPPSTPPATPPEYVTDTAKTQTLEETIRSLQRQFDAATRNLALQPRHDSVRSHIANIPIVKNQRRERDRSLRHTSIVSERETNGSSEASSIIGIGSQARNIPAEKHSHQDALTREFFLSGRGNNQSSEPGVSRDSMPRGQSSVQQIKTEHGQRTRLSGSDVERRQLEKKKSHLSTYVASLQKQLSDETVKSDTLSTNLRTIEQDLSSLSAEVEYLRSEIAAWESRHEDAEVEYTIAKAELNGVIASCRKEAEQLKAKLERQGKANLEQAAVIEDCACRMTTLEVGQAEIGRVLGAVQHSQTVDDAAALGVPTLDPESGRTPTTSHKIEQTPDSIAAGPEQTSQGSQTQPCDEVTGMLDRISHLEAQQTASMRSVLGRKMKTLARHAHVGDWAARGRSWKGGVEKVVLQQS